MMTASGDKIIDNKDGNTFNSIRIKMIMKERMIMITEIIISLVGVYVYINRLIGRRRV